MEMKAFANLDFDRRGRTGFAEVLFGQGKQPAHLLAILRTFRERGEAVLATRVSQAQADFVRDKLPGLVYDPLSSCLLLLAQSSGGEGPFDTGDERVEGAQLAGRLLVHLPDQLRGFEVETANLLHFLQARQGGKSWGRLAVVSAGTADAAVAAEVAVSAAFLGLQVQCFPDVGVAGLHRLLSVLEDINACDVLVVVAGMEGALVSVLAGLTERPLLAVPSGVSYGLGAGGESTLMAMLNSCAPGVAVLNIGNGFGAAQFAAKLCRSFALRGAGLATADV